MNNFAEKLTDNERREIKERAEIFECAMHNLIKELGKAIVELQKIENKCNKDICKQLEHVILILRSGILAIIATGIER